MRPMGRGLGYKEMMDQMKSLGRLCHGRLRQPSDLEIVQTLSGILLTRDAKR